MCHLYKLSSQNLYFYERRHGYFHCDHFWGWHRSKWDYHEKCRKDHKIVFISHGMSGSTLIFLHQVSICVCDITYLCNGFIQACITWRSRRCHWIYLVWFTWRLRTTAKRRRWWLQWNWIHWAISKRWNVNVFQHLWEKIKFINSRGSS